MGRTFQFECPHCRYQARVSGGADAGVNCSIQTIYCRDCRELFDIFIRIRKKVSSPEPAPAPGRSSAPRRQLLLVRSDIPPTMLMEEPWPDFQPNHPRHPLPPVHWEEIKPACPVGKTHQVQPWNDPGRCPRCGNFMEKNSFAWRRWE